VSVVLLVATSKAPSARSGEGSRSLSRPSSSNHVSGVYWEILLGAYTDPKQIFGPIDVRSSMRSSNAAPER